SYWPGGGSRSNCTIAIWAPDTARATGRRPSPPWSSRSRCCRCARTGSSALKGPDLELAGHATSQGPPRPEAPVLLVVDDDPRTRDLVTGELRKRYGSDYQVICVDS